jgi:hypothetical protein
LDNDTRWDTDLDLLERVLHFDGEILALYAEEALEVPADCVLTREQFDLAYGMMRVLEPVREFTKWAQFRNVVTLAYLPQKIDALLNQLAPGRLDAQLRGRTATSVALLVPFQTRLREAVLSRFSGVFEGDSIALAARYFLPGKSIFQFTNFQLGDEALEAVRKSLPVPLIMPEVRSNILDDSLE